MQKRIDFAKMVLLTDPVSSHSFFATAFHVRAPSNIDPPITSLPQLL
jgi:hypothetical protein